MRTTSFVVVMIAMGASFMASADAIKVGDKVLENVYVTEGATIYYVSVPDDGSVLNVAKSEVDPKSVVITQDREARKALYAAWLDKRRAQQGVASSTEAEVVNVVEPPKKEEPAEKEKTLKKVSGTGSQSGGSGQTAWYDAAQQQYYDSVRAAREAQVAARRRNRESEKVRMLTQRQVITSESSGGARGMNGMGGMGGMNQGGFGGMNQGGNR
jgi:hypothetical protein